MTPAHANHGLRARLWRVLGRHVYRCTPYGSFRMRRFVLRCFGATLDPQAKIRRSVWIDAPWNLTVGAKTTVGDGAALRGFLPISIGDRSTVSQLAILATESGDRDSGPITIEDDCWVATDTLVLPGSTIQQGTVVGARSLVIGDLPPWSIAVGQPAVVRGQRRFRDDSDTGTRTN